MTSQKWSAKDLKNKWVRKYPANVSKALPWDVLELLVECLSVDTGLPRERLAAVIQQRDVSGLFSIADSLDVTAYTSPDLLLQDRIVVDMFSKFDFPDSPFNKREKAKLRFFEAEEMCRSANRRIIHSKDLTNDVNSVIHRAIRIISSTLGNFDLDEMLRFCRFGPGASLCVKGPFTTEYFKFCEKSPTVSDDAFPYADALVNYDVKWKAYLSGINPIDVVGPFSPLEENGPELTTVSYNKVTFVSKNAKTERSIAIEPYFNIYFQLGVGAMIRRRLFRRLGVNLDSQKRNQALALIGSLTQQLATIDFSMASDTISIEVCRLLLPPEWFDHMDRLRSKSYSIQGDVSPRVYQKFSTMGNGYTFELETLIFYALALASCDELGEASTDLTVYGDDVILPCAAAGLFIKSCSYLGFKVNEEKSFTTGGFRESCGEDYLDGVSVRPVFCKELETVQHVASLANRLFELNRSVGVGSRVNDMLDNAVALLHSRIPRDVVELVVGPPSENYDGYIHTTCTARLAGSALVIWNRHLQCWSHPIFQFKAKRFRRHDGAVALWLNHSLAPRYKAISDRKEEVLEGLRLIARTPAYLRLSRLEHRPSYLEQRLDDYISEKAELTITGRNIGEIVLTTNLFWSFPEE